MRVTQALEIMKTHVVTVSEDSTLADAIDRMDLYQVDELPVLDENAKLCGMLCEHDVAATLAAMIRDGTPDLEQTVADLSCRLVRDILKPCVFSVRDTDEVTEHLVDSILNSFRRVVVLDDVNRVIGTLNRVDIIQALFEKTIQIEQLGNR